MAWTSKISLVLGLVATAAYSHPDGTGDMINDVITFEELTALSDQDDGGGESEYCVRISSRHGDTHTLMTTERLRCYDVDWDDPSTEAGKQWHELKDMRLPLIGTARAVDTNLIIAYHFHECVPSAPWVVTSHLYEVDYSPAGEILNDIAKLIEDEGKTVASIFGISDPRVLATTGVAAKFARLAGKWIDKIVNDASDLGVYEAVFQDGIGDPDSTVLSKAVPDGQHFRARFSKGVAKVGQCAGPRTRYFLADTHRSVDESGAACLRNDSSPLCLNSGGASKRQFETLRQISGRIDDVVPEPETDATAEGSFAMRVGLIGLTGEIARSAALAQLDQAAEAPAATDILLELAPALTAAEKAFAIAVEEASTDHLIQSINGFETVHSALAGFNYDEAFQARWAATLETGMVRAQGLARTALATQDRPAAQGHVSGMLMTFAMLDPQMREQMLPLMRELFGVSLTDYFELPLGIATNKLLEQL
ncbi:hypothetical protein [Thalassovita taeanensis]|uniref:Uncharacterized protein n=1 Tax=Thalassovita taeanensis TaxID=657014 RepID=A0A1H8YSA4_9RHOB|nr:hypothetical protein [Thalassovita taeanensis]SEP55050.1 hypothetical protein SAMN04488092_10146 [Thalassovita taeanensis]